MGTLELFEQLACNAHYNVDIKILVNQAPQKIQAAMLLGDGEILKSLISGSVYLANESHVVQV